MANNVPMMTEALTKEQFKKVLPANFKGNVTDSVINDINQLLLDVDLAQNFKDNLLSFTTVLQDGKFKLVDYLNAVRYVSYKLLGATNESAYTKTFPDRYQRFMDEGKTPKEISSFVSAYNKTKLVQSIFEQTLTPTWVLNAPILQEAINVQADLMRNASSEKVRTEAANSLMNHLKRPETNKMQLQIDTGHNESIDALREELSKLNQAQKQFIQSGAATAKNIAHEGLVIENGEVVDE